jgi:putative ABC transport system permease protein
VLSQAALVRIPSLLPPSVPLLTPPRLDAATLALGAIVTLIAAAALVAWPFARTRVVAAPAGRGTPPLGRNRVFRGLVIAQVAMAMALVAPAALLQQSLDAVRRQDPGFVVDRVLVADVTLAGPAYSTVDGIVSAERTLDSSLTAIPGVRSVAFAYDQPLEANWLDSFSLSGSVAGRDDTSGSAELRIVSPSYFEAMKVAVIDGRGFTEDDGAGSAGVALVNEAFAARLTDGPALNRMLRSGTPRNAWQDPRIPGEFRIVGIVENERFKGLEQPSAPAVYLSTRQFPQAQVTVLLRTSVEPITIASAVRTAIRRVNPGIPVGTMMALSDILAAQLVARRVTTHVVDGFAAAALALAVLGLYGLLALLVASGTRETGIRLALGSSPGIEAMRVVRECLGSTVIGLSCGVALALMGGQMVRSLLFGVSSTDTMTLAGAAFAIIVAGLAAAALPAWRTSRVDPAAVLRG